MDSNRAVLRFCVCIKSAYTCLAYCMYFDEECIKNITIEKHMGLHVRAVMTNPNYKGSSNKKSSNGGNTDSTNYEKPIVIL